jgi:hypothetical protein
LQEAVWGFFLRAVEEHCASLLGCDPGKNHCHVFVSNNMRDEGSGVPIPGDTQCCPFEIPARSIPKLRKK